ncbi:hypothetical protein ACH0BF_08615 [Pseudobacillus sp. 179-B 2D1 NHS]|uniref:hypothetical protein n=1 Tax=Pseudobacillus sp. 179-B 2D1 NHS TaxID=3374292 RepID=UPI0038792666
MPFQTLTERAKSPYAQAPAAGHEKRKRLFRLSRHKSDRQSDAFCHTGVTAYDRESSRYSWTREKRKVLALCNSRLEKHLFP